MGFKVPESKFSIYKSMLKNIQCEGEYIFQHLKCCLACGW